jgi:folate-binding protein YgfZ
VATGTISTPLEALHVSAGAQMGTWFGCSLPSRFSGAAEEYRFARQSVALVDKNYRAYFAFTGPDRARYLNAVLTNNIQDLAAGQGCIALLLNAQGHIVAEIEVYAMVDRHWAASYAMIRETLAATLDKYIIMDDVTLEDITGQRAVLALEGPQTNEVLRILRAPQTDWLTELGHTETVVAGIPCRLVRRSPGGVPGCEFIVEHSRVEELWRTLSATVREKGGGPIGYETLNVVRLEAGIPWFGYDFSEKQIPHEAGLQDTHISYTKGCYTGQEIVERVRSRGHVNRVRVGLRFDGEEPVPAGTTLFAEGSTPTASAEDIGYVTRTGFSPAAGSVIGMGYVRTGNAAGSKLRWTGGSAEIIEFPIGPRAGRSTGS